MTGNREDAPGVLDAAASRKSLQAIRARAVDAFLTLPRVGMGIGGFLLGIRRGGKIQILDRIEIPCAHAMGPAFALTADEKEYALRLRRSSAPLEVVGFYVSKTRGLAELAGADGELFNELCPGADDVAIVVRPSTVQAVRAALYSRGPDQKPVLRGEWEMDASHVVAPSDFQPVPEPAPSLTAAPAAKQPLSETPVEIISPATHAPPPAPAKPEPFRDAAPDIPRRTQAPEPPALFRKAGNTRKKADRSLLLTAGSVCLILVGVGLLTRGPLLQPELSLQVREDSGAIVFHWNREAVAGAQRGRISISDSGQLLQIPLDPAQLAAGSFRYERKSDRVVAKLEVGERSARVVYFGNPRTQPSH